MFIIKEIQFEPVSHYNLDHRSVELLLELKGK